MRLSDIGDESEIVLGNHFKRDGSVYMFVCEYSAFPFKRSTIEIRGKGLADDLSDNGLMTSDISNAGLRAATR